MKDRDFTKKSGKRINVSPWTAGQACPRPVRSGPKYEQTPSSGIIVYKNIYCPWPSQTKVWRTVRRLVLVLVTAVRIPNRASFFVRIKACDTYV